MVSRNINFTIHTLQEIQVDRAYVLAQTAMPLLTLAFWRRISCGAERGNFTVATDINDHIRGLCHARVENNPIAGRVFDVTIFVVVSLLHEQEIAASLFAAMKEQAIEAKCKYLRIWTTRPGNWSLLDDREFRNRWDHGTIYPL